MWLYWYDQHRLVLTSDCWCSTTMPKRNTFKCYALVHLTEYWIRPYLTQHALLCWLICSILVKRSQWLPTFPPLHAKQCWMFFSSLPPPPPPLPMASHWPTRVFTSFSCASLVIYKTCRQSDTVCCAINSADYIWSVIQDLY